MNTNSNERQIESHPTRDKDWSVAYTQVGHQHKTKVEQYAHTEEEAVGKLKDVLDHKHRD